MTAGVAGVIERSPTLPEPCDCTEARLYRQVVRDMSELAANPKPFRLFGVPFVPKPNPYVPRHAKDVS